MQYTYGLILIGSLLFPLFRSFGPPLHFNRKFPTILPAIIITAVPFLIWDHIFTDRGNWGFNEKYITGIQIFGLPVEECLFFLVIPYCCMFIYEVVRLKLNPFMHSARIVNWVLLVLFAVLSVSHSGEQYTIYAAVLGMLVLSANWLIQPQILPLFYTSFSFMLIPFLVVNGLLTGAFIQEEVVWYNDHENLDIRLFTIPVEDFIYCFDMMLCVAGIHEFMQRRNSRA